LNEVVGLHQKNDKDATIARQPVFPLTRLFAMVAGKYEYHFLKNSSLYRQPDKTVMEQ